MKMRKAAHCLHMAGLRCPLRAGPRHGRHECGRWCRFGCLEAKRREGGAPPTSCWRTARRTSRRSKRPAGRLELHGCHERSRAVDANDHRALSKPKAATTGDRHFAKPWPRVLLSGMRRLAITPCIRLEGTACLKPGSRRLPRGIASQAIAMLPGPLRGRLELPFHRLCLSWAHCHLAVGHDAVFVSP